MKKDTAAVKLSSRLHLHLWWNASLPIRDWTAEFFNTRSQMSQSKLLPSNSASQASKCFSSPVIQVVFLYKALHVFRRWQQSTIASERLGNRDGFQSVCARHSSKIEKSPIWEIRLTNHAWWVGPLVSVCRPGRCCTAGKVMTNAWMFPQISSWPKSFTGIGINQTLKCSCLLKPLQPCCHGLVEWP